MSLNIKNERVHSLARQAAQATGRAVEVGIVADAKSARHGERLDALLRVLEIEIEPVTERQSEIARLAYRRFGRGSGSKASLNFGDCLSYALSVTVGEPLLYIGTDFTHTDVAAQPH